MVPASGVWIYYCAACSDTGNNPQDVFGIHSSSLVGHELFLFSSRDERITFLICREISLKEMGIFVFKKKIRFD